MSSRITRVLLSTLVLFALLLGSTINVKAANSVALEESLTYVTAACGESDEWLFSATSPAEGDLLLIAVQNKGSTTLPSAPSDEQGNTYVEFESAQYGSGGSSRGARVWYAISNGTDVGNLVVTVPCSDYSQQVMIYWFSGTAESNPIDLHGHKAWQGEVDQTIWAASHTSGVPQDYAAESNELAVFIVMSVNNNTYTDYTAENPTYTVETVHEQISGATLGSIAVGYTLDGNLDPELADQPTGAIVLDSSNVTTSQATLFMFGVLAE